MLSRWLKKIFGRSHAKIGIYGPPNSGKTTLANKITNDWILFLQCNAGGCQVRKRSQLLRSLLQGSMHCKGGIQRKNDKFRKLKMIGGAFVSASVCRQLILSSEESKYLS